MLLVSLFSMCPEVVIRGGGVRVGGGQGGQQVLGVCNSSLPRWIHCCRAQLHGGAARPDGKHPAASEPPEMSQGIY